VCLGKEWRYSIKLVELFLGDLFGLHIKLLALIAELINLQHVVEVALVVGSITLHHQTVLIVERHERGEEVLNFLHLCNLI
jgi:hypothetical protein